MNQLKAKQFFRKKIQFTADNEIHNYHWVYQYLTRVNVYTVLCQIIDYCWFS